MEELWQYTWFLPYAGVAVVAGLFGAWRGWREGLYAGCMMDRETAWNLKEAERVRRGGPRRYVRSGEG